MCVNNKFSVTDPNIVIPVCLVCGALTLCLLGPLKVIEVGMVALAVICGAILFRFIFVFVMQYVKNKWIKENQNYISIGWVILGMIIAYWLTSKISNTVGIILSAFAGSFLVSLGIYCFIVFKNKF